MKKLIVSFVLCVVCVVCVVCGQTVLLTSRHSSTSTVSLGARSDYGARVRAVYTWTARRCDDGQWESANTRHHCWTVWTESNHNTSTTAGVTDMLQNEFKGSSYTAAWYVGLKNTGSAATSDTMPTHSGWTENTTYSNATRPAWSGGTASSGSIDNAASQAAFSINGTTTVYGSFLCTNSTKGGTTGTLYGAADFTNSRSLYSGDTLNVTVTLTATAQ